MRSLEGCSSSSRATRVGVMLGDPAGQLRTSGPQDVISICPLIFKHYGTILIQEYTKAIVSVTVSTPSKEVVYRKCRVLVVGSTGFKCQWSPYYVSGALFDPWLLNSKTQAPYRFVTALLYLDTLPQPEARQSHE